MTEKKWKKAELADIVWEVKRFLLIAITAEAILLYLIGVPPKVLPGLLAVGFLLALLLGWLLNSFLNNWVLCPCGKTFGNNEGQCPRCGTSIPANLFEQDEDDA